MDENTLLQQIKENPQAVEFQAVMSVVDAHYDYTATRFTNGSGDNTVINEAGQNEGSCRVFAFAQLHDLDEQQTLACFGRYYREDVLQHPDATDHANIRQFMRTGWSGIQFDHAALIAKSA